MTSPFLGELMGTMVLILLGDGVVAGVLLNKSKAQNAGWIVITTGWAFAVMCWRLYGDCVRQQQADLNPAVTLAAKPFYTGHYDNLLTVHSGPTHRRVHRRGAGLSALPAALGRDRG